MCKLLWSSPVHDGKLMEIFLTEQKKKTNHIKSLYMETNWIISDICTFDIQSKYDIQFVLQFVSLIKYTNIINIIPCYNFKNISLNSSTLYK